MSRKCKRPPLTEPLERRTLLSLTPVGPEFRINTTTANDERRPAIAMDADGDFVAVWTSYVPVTIDGGDPPPIGDVYAQRYNAAGVPQGDEFRVNTTTPDSQRLPDVAMDAAGNFVIAWTSFSPSGSAEDIIARRYNAAGVAQSGEFHVNTFTTANQVAPSLAMDVDGDFVVVWSSYSQEEMIEPGVYAQRYNAAGVPQGGEFRVNTHTPGTQRFGSIAMDDAGNFVVAWDSFLQDGSGIGVYAQRYNAAGAPQGGEFRVNTHTTNHQNEPSVAVDSNGDFVIAWTSDSQDGAGTGVYARRYNSAGIAQGGEFRVNTFTTAAQRRPDVAIDDDGDFVISWGSQQDGSHYGIYAQCYNAAGVPQGTEFRVNTFTQENQHEASVAMDADGDAVIAWTSGLQDGASHGVYAQRYATDASPVINSSSFVFESVPHRLQFSFSQNVSASLSTADILLENLTTAQTIPSAQLLLSYDVATNTATFTYTGNASGISGILPDGDFRATLLAAGITGPGGTPLASNHVFNFFFLNGDADRDGRVNLNDFNILAANFGQSNRSFSHGDFTYDTIVNLNDFNILAGRFGQVLGPASAGVGSPPSLFAGRDVISTRSTLLAGTFGQSGRTFSQGNFNYDTCRAGGDPGFQPAGESVRQEPASPPP